MRRAFRLFLTSALSVGLWSAAEAQGMRQIKVVVNFTQSGTSSQETFGGSGGVAITRRSVRPEGRFGVEDKQTTVQRTSGIFTLVQDGGAASMLVATRVPYAEAAYYYNYLTGAGYVTTRIVFQDVGTALKVEAQVLPQNQIRLRLMPRISYFSAEGAGAIDVVEAATELVVPSGQPVSLGGAATAMHEVTRRIFGYDARSGAGESAISVVATLQ